MTTKTIVRLEKRRSRLTHALTETDNQLYAARRRDEKATADRNDRKYFALGCAAELGLNTLWSEQLCREFSMMECAFYPATYLHASTSDTANPFLLIDGSRRQTRIRWGNVAFLMILYTMMAPSELEIAVRRLRHAGLRNAADSQNI